MCVLCTRTVVCGGQWGLLKDEMTGVVDRGHIK